MGYPSAGAPMCSFINSNLRSRFWPHPGAWPPICDERSAVKACQGRHRREAEGLTASQAAPGEDAVGPQSRLPRRPVALSGLDRPAAVDAAAGLSHDLTGRVPDDRHLQAVDARLRRQAGAVQVGIVVGRAAERPQELRGADADDKSMTAARRWRVECQPRQPLRDFSYDACDSRRRLA